MSTLTIEAAAKINWRLKIVGRRPDGYHLLCGLMQSISLADTIYLRTGARDSCRISIGPPIKQEDNLAYAAWLLLKRELNLGYSLEIEIEKRIPPGGGLGGGSADAAAVLNGANELFELGLSLEDLSRIGLLLGADIPFCLLGGLAQAEGVGEKLVSLPPPDMPLLLVNAGFRVPTAQVYAHYAQSGYAFAAASAEREICAKLSAALNSGDIPAINALLDNDLAQSVRQLYPAIGALEQQLRALGLTPQISGSGGTVFALVESSGALKKAKQALANVPWVTETYTGRATNNF